MKFNLQHFSTAKAKPEEAPEMTVEEYFEERVPVKLFKDGKEYKDDVVIHFNGEIIQIRRGETVMLKRKHAMILEQQESQNIYATQLLEGLANQFESDSSARGIDA